MTSHGPKPLVFADDDGMNVTTLTVRNDSRGEPFRSGLSFDFDSGDTFVRCFVYRDSELEAIRDMLNDYLKTPRR